MDNSLVKVLLIDDDEDDYVLTRDWFREFEDSKFKLQWIDSPQAARDAIAQKEHDIYLLDYRLGEYNGLEILREAIDQGCSAPIILLTGQGDHEIDVEAMKAGAADYLEKSQLSAPLLERSIRYAIERQHAQAKIREQAALLDVATDAIFVSDAENTILFWNKAAEKLYGWKASEAIGKKALELWQEENLSDVQQANNILLNHGSWQGEFHQKTKFGKKILVESRWTLLPFFEGKPESILVVNTDITHKKQLETQFFRTQRLESIGTLASGIAHDLNNVLAPILMSAQLLELQLKDERSQRLLPILISNAKRGANLVKQVLSFARGIEGERTLLQVKHLILEIQHIIKETFPKSIMVNVEICPNLWTVYSDATQLHQVLMNLCVNARDAMSGGGTLTITCENLLIDQNYAQMHLDAQERPYVVITVADTGVGISQDILDRIFEPFFTTKELGQGTGLGLSTALGIIKSHDGFVNVYSELNRGTSFKVYLPAVETKEIEVIEQQDLPSGNGELILVVDDESAVREITKTSLETHNYQTLTASDGIDAVAVYAQHKEKISVVLTDMVMPDMDGNTTIRTLQKINSDVKIIAMSGLASNDKVSGAYDLGVKAFLAKPYTAQQLLETIKSVVNSN